MRPGGREPIMAPTQPRNPGSQARHDDQAQHQHDPRRHHRRSRRCSTDLRRGRVGPGPVQHHSSQSGSPEDGAIRSSHRWPARHSAGSSRSPRTASSSRPAPDWPPARRCAAADNGGSSMAMQPTMRMELVERNEDLHRDHDDEAPARFQRPDDRVVRRPVPARRLAAWRRLQALRRASRTRGSVSSTCSPMSPASSRCSMPSASAPEDQRLERDEVRRQPGRHRRLRLQLQERQLRAAGDPERPAVEEPRRADLGRASPSTSNRRTGAAIRS